MLFGLLTARGKIFVKWDYWILRNRYQWNTIWNIHMKMWSAGLNVSKYLWSAGQDLDDKKCDYHLLQTVADKWPVRRHKSNKWY